MMHPAERLYGELRDHRSAVALTVYGAIAFLAYSLAYLLRFDLSWPREYSGVFLTTLPLLIVLRVAFARVFKLTSGRWRFVGTRDVLRLAGAVTLGTVTFYALTRGYVLALPVPRSVILIEWVLSGYLTAAIWITYRTAFEELRHRRSGFNGSATRVLIVGAGEAGSMLAREMRRFPTGYRPIGFVDDDPSKCGTRLHGLEVFGSTAHLRSIAHVERAGEIVIAVPSAGPVDLRRVVACCEETDLPFKVLPGISEVLSGEVRLHQLREVQIEDLLGRDPIELELPELAQDLRGGSTLITGGAGSIGSELARQVARYGPGRLILLDQAETDLYYLELELRDRHPELDFVPVVGDVVDMATVERVFQEYAPERVFHAAAYKHVPMMEVNRREAVRNNVIGTWRVADAAGRHGAEKFVLVSTDKAVRPVSIMGATKRLSEMVALELQLLYPETAYAGVRFGNVLGSSGSVIPVFKRQLEAGKPLTVTHPDATRYFMTIPEAVQLILQASMLPELNGRIAILEMGDPIRIVDLAENLLHLSGAYGRNGHGVIFTGLRPGERLHEELVAPDEVTHSTAISKVRLVELNGDLSHAIVDLIRSGGHDLDHIVDRLHGRLSELFPLLDGRPDAAGSQPLIAAASGQ